jgi:D-glycero-alpha-D-manno-heptose 1-phosphate guanylyltransferase
MTRDSSVPCIILAGGLGTRLSEVLPDLPKCLAPVHGRPFLQFQIDALMAQGVTRFVLSLGHLADKVEQAVAVLRRPGAQILCVVESAPLGTGGAILHTLRSLGLTEALVANGDTLLDGSLAEMLVPLDLSAGVLARVATVSVPDRSRYGCVLMDADGRVTGFREKGHGGTGPINAGFYRVHVDAFGPMPAQSAFSFETATLTTLAQRRALAASRIDGTFIDIGVPSEYRRFCEERGGT